MSYETDRIAALEKLVCDQAQQIGHMRLAQVDDSAQHSLEVRLLTEERDEARAALREALYIISGYDDDEASKQFHETVERWRKAAGVDK